MAAQDLRTHNDPVINCNMPGFELSVNAFDCAKFSDLFRLDCPQYRLPTLIKSILCSPCSAKSHNFRRQQVLEHDSQAKLFNLQIDEQPDVKLQKTTKEISSIDFKKTLFRKVMIRLQISTEASIIINNRWFNNEWKSMYNTTMGQTPTNLKSLANLPRWLDGFFMFLIIVYLGCYFSLFITFLQKFEFALFETLYTLALLVIANSRFRANILLFTRLAYLDPVIRGLINTLGDLDKQFLNCMRESLFELKGLISILTLVNHWSIFHYEHIY